jgi:hypothetical protein
MKNRPSIKKDTTKDDDFVKDEIFKDRPQKAVTLRQQIFYAGISVAASNTGPSLHTCR